MNVKQIARRLGRIEGYQNKISSLIKEISGFVPSVEKTEKQSVQTTTEKKARSGRKGQVNRSQLVRDYFEKHGKDVRPKDVIQALKKNGIEVPSSLVSTIKKNLGISTPKNKVLVKKVEKVEKTEKSSAPLPKIVQEVLLKNKDGLRLKEVMEKVQQAGYKYKGNKPVEQGLYSNVYQTLHNLASKKPHAGFEGNEPVVIHDGSSHMYKLNPEAKRSA